MGTPERVESNKQEGRSGGAAFELRTKVRGGDFPVCLVPELDAHPGLQVRECSVP